MTKLESNLLDSLEEVVTITCTKCSRDVVYHGVNAFDILDTVMNQGWYATGLNTYCPNCNNNRKLYRIPKKSK